MQVFNSLADLAGLIPPPPPAPEAETPAPYPRTYDCTGCRFVDSNGLVCGFCLRKILDNQAEKKQNRESLMAATRRICGALTPLCGWASTPMSCCTISTASWTRGAAGCREYKHSTAQNPGLPQRLQ